MNWIQGDNGNRASVEYWGSEKAARNSLATLKECENCSDCSRCSGCSDCSDCSDCSRCSDCSGCSGCSDCSDCSDCSRCSRCSRCSDCSGLENNAPKAFPEIPVIENIHQQVLEAVSRPNALNMESWHTCGTTH